MRNRNQEAAVIVIGCACLTVVALGREVRQEWRLRESGRSDRVHFTVERSKPGNSNSFSHEVPLDRFHGLPADAFRQGRSVTFDYVHDAGTLHCKGGVTWGRGSGSFTFTPNPAYAVELKKLGYDEPDREQQLLMTIADVGLPFAREVRDAGLHASTRQLLDLAWHGITLEYVREMQKAGYKDVTAGDVIELRNHGVETGFLRELATLGYDLRTRDVVQLRDHGVNADFLADLKDAGYELPTGRIVELRNHGVDSQYLRDLKRYQLQPAASDIVQFRNHGVSPEYLRELDDAGYGNLSANEVCNLRNHGVPADFIREAKALGFQFTSEELTQLRDRGVDARYLHRIKDSGLKNLSAGDIAKLKSHGVD